MKVVQQSIGHGYLCLSDYIALLPSVISKMVRQFIGPQSFSSQYCLPFLIIKPTNGCNEIKLWSNKIHILDVPEPHLPSRYSMVEQSSNSSRGLELFYLIIKPTNGCNEIKLWSNKTHILDVPEPHLPWKGIMKVVHQSIGHGYVCLSDYIALLPPGISKMVRQSIGPQSFSS